MSPCSGEAQPPLSEAEFGLSYGQRAMWFLHELAPESAVYNVPGAIRIRSAVDVGALRRAMGSISARHPALRTCFRTEAGEPVQRVLPRVEPELHHESAAGWDDDRLNARLSEETHRPFDLGRAPLYRAFLFSRGARDHVFLLVFHHIVTDFWSQALYLKELGELYRQERRGVRPALQPLAVGYEDHVRRERERMEGKEGERLWAYWRDRLSGPLPVLDLPQAKPRPPVQSYRGASHVFTLPDSLTRGIEALARARDATPATVILAGWFTLLYRYTGSEDLIVGSMTSGRADDFTGVMGYFTNPVPLRVHLDPELDFGAVLDRVRTAFFGGLEHQHLPFPHLVERLQPERDPARSPIVQAMYVWQRVGGAEAQHMGAGVVGSGAARLGELVVEAMPRDHRVSQFDLILMLTESDAGLGGRLDYCTDLFDADTARRLHAHLETLLRAATERPETPVSRLPLLTEDERCWALETLNETAEPFPEDALLHEGFEAWARERPEAEAVVAGDGVRLSYGELAALSERLAQRLRSAGARPNTLVAVVMEKGWEQVAAVLAVLEAGAAYLPVDAGLPAERIRHLLERGEVELALTQPWLRGRLEWPEGVERVEVEREAADGTGAPAGAAAGTPPIEPRLKPAQGPEDLAYVIFTSGSTGQPKGVMIDHRGAVNTVTDVNRRFGIGPGDRVLALSSLSFDLSVYDIFGTLAAGATIVIPEADAARDPARWAEWVESEGVTMWDSVPALVEMLVGGAEERADGARALSTLRLVLMSGDWIPVSLPERIRALVPEARLISMGGATEASIWSILHPIEAVDPEWKSIPYGRPMANQRFYVLDAAMEPMPVGVPGALYIGGVGVAKGYWRDGERTRASFVTHPATRERLYRTGDLGRYRPDGTIEFLGRDDFQVKIQGYRVELGEIEATLLAHPGVRDAVADARPDVSGGKRLVAYVVPRGGDPPSPEDLRVFLRARLPEYMVPAAVVPLRELPLSANGKVDRKALPDPARAAQAVRATRTQAEKGEARAPRSQLESTLSALWSEVMELNLIGVDEDFFELGGHSLLAMALLARVRQEMGVELPLRRFLLAPTVEAMAEALLERPEGAVPQADATPLAPLVAPPVAPLVPDPACRFEPFPLTDLQEAYWIGERDFLELGSVAAHNYVEIDAPDLHLERLHAALQRLVERHDALRTVVLPEGVQQVLDPAPRYPLPVTDLRAASAEEREASIEVTRAEMCTRGRPADRWPLLEMRAHRLGERHYRLHVNLSLLVTDARSAGIFIRELERLYLDPRAELPELECTYRDYVLAERALRESDEYERARRYWQERMDALPPSPELPLARPPRGISAPLMVRHRGRLGPEAWQALRERARRAGLTVNAVLCTAYAEVLATWSRKPHFTMNVLLDDRLPLHPGIGRILGTFSATVLLEVDTSGREPFADRARRLQEQLWSDIEHRRYTGVRVIQEMNRRRAEVGRAGMPVVFASTLDVGGGGGDLRRGEEAPPSPLGRVESAALQTPQVWIDHNISEDAGELAFNWDVVEALFPPGLVDAMFAAYQDLLARLAADGAAWTNPGASLVPPAHLDIFSRTNATEAPYPSDSLLHELFAARVDEDLGRTAVVWKGGRLSYGELDAVAEALARQLRAAGARPNALVAVVMEKGWEQVAAVLAVLKSGAAYLPVDAGLPARRIRHLLERGEVELALTQSWLEERVAWPSGVGRIAVTLGESAPDGGSSARPRLEPVQRPEDLAYVIFTSGSTGEPKGVMIDHRGAANTVTDVNRRFGVGPPDRVLALSSLSFDLSVYDVFGTLAAGATIVIPEADAARDPARWAEWVAAEGVTVWNSVPALVELLVSWAESEPDKDVDAGSRRGPKALSSLRLVMMSGDWIGVKLPERIRGVAPAATLISMGGATEASIWSILHAIDRVDPEWKSIPYGRPMANQRFHVLDDDLESVPVWVPGELYIGGEGVAKGYWRDEERTRASFVTHPRTGERLYRTGDLGRYWPDGTIEFLGREDFQVKVQGYRVELGEIEAVLLDHPRLAAAAVTAMGERRGHKRLVAFVVPGESVPSAEELRAHLAARLPDYMVPPVLRFTESLPLSPNGKVDRNALVSAETFSPAGAHAHVSPRDALETELARIWKDVLGVDSVGVSDDFFELGGDSVLAVRMMVGVQRALGTTLPLSTLMRAATVEHLASALRHDATSDAWSPLVPILENGSTKPPLFLVHPIGGNVLCYQALARRVGFGRSVYGLQSPGLSGREPPCTSVEEMARRYLQQIREVQPEGPYLLGGWSMGGIVAWEIACQLQREGSQVELLAVLDSRAPGSFSGVDAAPAADVDVDVLSDFLQDLRGRPTEPEELGLLARAQPEERDAHLLEAARRSGLLPTGAEPGHLKPLLDVFRANRTAMHGYRPPLYVGDLMLFRAVGEEASASATGNGTPDHTLGWQALATEPVRIHNVPGDHYTLLTPPNVYFVAERLRHGLEAAGRTWAPPEVTS